MEKVKLNARLNTKEIFKQMSNVICQLNSSSQEGTAFFINDTGRLVTVYHNALNQSQLLEHNYIIKFNGKKYKAVIFVPPCFYITDIEERTGKYLHIIERSDKKQTPDFNICLTNYLAKCNKLDLILLQIIDDIPKTKCFELGFDPSFFEEGTKVYFGGYPLSLPNPTYHRGIVSSKLIDENTLEHFTIDGTVVPGNSGSPVVIEQKGKLFLIGIVFSEVADLDPKFLEIESRLNEGKNAPIAKIGPFDIFNILSMTLSVIKRNMSTGIGRAINATYIIDLFDINRKSIDVIGILVSRYDFYQLANVKGKREQRN